GGGAPSDARARAPAGSAEHHRERDRARPLREQDDARDARALPRRDRGVLPARAHRRARGRGGRGDLPRLARGRVPDGCRHPGLRSGRVQLDLPGALPRAGRCAVERGCAGRRPAPRARVLLVGERGLRKRGRPPLLRLHLRAAPARRLPPRGPRAWAAVRARRPPHRPPLRPARRRAPRPERALRARRARERPRAAPPPPPPFLALPPRPPSSPRAPRLGAALMLSGHTHGGQLALPWSGRRTRNLAEFISAFDRGLYRDGDATLYVNRGLGFTGQKIRLFTPREIACLTLRAR